MRTIVLVLALLQGLSAFAQVSQPRPEPRPQQPVTEVDPTTADDKPLPPEPEGQWVDPSSFCAPLIDDAVAKTYALAVSKARALAKNFSCGASATKGETLELLSKTLSLARSFSCMSRPNNEDAMREQIKKDPDLAAGLGDYVGYRFLVKGLQVNNLDSDEDAAKAGEAFPNTTFYLDARVENYSPSFQIKFLPQGLAQVRELNADGEHIDTYPGHWTIALKKDPAFEFRKLLIIDLRVHGRVEHMVVEGEFGGSWSSIRLRKLAGTQFDDPSGWVNEVRACFQ